MRKNIFITTISLAFCLMLNIGLSGCTSAAKVKADESKSRRMVDNFVITKVVVIYRDTKEKVFEYENDIYKFVKAIQTGAKKENIPPELKPPPYFVYFYNADGEKVEYFLYLDKDSGWILKNGSDLAYTLTKESAKELYELLANY